METRRSSWARLGSLLAVVAVALGTLAIAGLAPANVARAQGNEEQPSNGTFLGVILQDLDQSLRDSYGYDGSGGVLISQVDGGSPAERAGLRRGDIVLRFDGKQVDSASELSQLVRGTEPGERVSLTVWRSSRERTFSVQLGSRGEDQYRGDEGDERSAPPPPPAPEAPPAPQALPDRDEDEAGPTPAPSPGDLDERMSFFMVRPRLGIEVQDLNDDLREYFDAPDSKGVVVTRVLDNSPARRAGMRAGDVVVEIDGQRVENSNELRRRLAARAVGPVRLTVMRKGERRTLTAELERGRQPFGAGREPRPFGRRGVDPNQRDNRDLRDRDSRGGDDMQRELQQLRREMEQMRRELEQLRRDMRSQNRD